MIRLMERVHIHMPMEPITMETGLMTNNMVGAWNHGLMEPNTRGNIRTARKMVEASSLLQMAPSMMVNSRKMR